MPRLTRSYPRPRRSMIRLAVCAATAAALPAATGAFLPAGAAVPASTADGASTAGSVGGFAFGQLQTSTVGQAGCGTNTAGEPSIHVSKANLVAGGSEEGVGSGSEFWSAPQVGGSGASACVLVYRGQPNGTSKTGASGGDIDIAIAPVQDPATKHYRIYVASLNLASVNVATSTDDGKTFSQTPVQGGLPIDDREWIAAFGPATSLLSFHDITTNNINVLRSTNGGASYTMLSRAIPDTDYKATYNELGNLVIDHAHPLAAGAFWAYQSFVAPSKDPGPSGQVNTPANNEAFLAVSKDGGATWTDRPIPCTTKFGAKGLSHNFPNVSVAPDGSLYYAVSNDSSIYVAHSTDHGTTWSCSGPINHSGVRAIFPWLVAAGGGQDLVYYGTTGSGSSQVWYVYFAQRKNGSSNTWTTTRLMPVHKGAVCEGGVNCTNGRQLFDDFGVDTDQQGWAHIMYSHDAPALGGSGTFTGYAVQRSGGRIGAPN